VSHAQAGGECRHPLHPGPVQPLWLRDRLALQTQVAEVLGKADELRPEMPPGAAYLLARGPLPERGFVYVVVPDAKRSLVASLTPLSVIHVTARERAGRTRYLGNPVVDLLSLEVQSQP